MTVSTYVALDKKTLSTSATSVTFTSIPQTYTDLIIVADATLTANDSNLDIRLNGDSSTNYSYIQMAGTGSAAVGTYASSQSAGRLDYYGYLSTARYTNIIHIFNYTNTTTYKKIISRSGNPTNGTSAVVNLWSKAPEAITSIELRTGNSLAADSTFSLYGIKAWSNTEASPKATGGYVYSDSSYWYHAFPFSSTFTPNQSITADILVVAGGGGGGGFTGGNGNGGGGAGGLLTYTSQSLTATTYTCTVGSGGAGGKSASSSVSGVNSQFGALTASVGGGRGAHGGSAPNGASTGGSGGGGQGSNDLNYVNGAAGTSGQGYAGANGYNAGSFAGGGGGGGAGGAGQVAVADAIGGAGGIGATSALINAIGAATKTGHFVSSNYYYAGGGGGSTSTSSTAGTVSGGAGGGGTGYYDGGPAGGSGLGNTGGGGGAGRAANGGNGGSGIIVVRYAK